MSREGAQGTLGSMGSSFRGTEEGPANQCAKKSWGLGGEAGALKETRKLCLPLSPETRSSGLDREGEGRLEGLEADSRHALGESGRKRHPD